MNFDSVGAYGCPLKNITPNIDKLAKSGIRFENAHVTIAICMPTRAVWMTGRYPHRSGALGFDPIRKNVPTLLETLKKAGYFTGILAKVPHVVPSRKAAWDVIVPANKLAAGRSPSLYLKYTQRFIKSSKEANRPFFLMANAQDPHRPFAGSQNEKRRRNRRKAPKPGSPAAYPPVTRTFKPAEIPVPQFLPDLAEIRRELAWYFASVHRSDQVVGSVLQAIDEAGVKENTLVLFCSDHGMPLPFAKTNCWLNSTKTPLIVRYPGTVKENTVDKVHFVGGIDIAPTILDVLGMPNLSGADGRSFLPVLAGKTQSRRDHVFTYINRTAGKREYPMRAVQDNRYGYIFNPWSDGKTVFRNESQSGLTMKAMIKAGKSDAKIAARVKHFLYRTKEELYDYANDPAALNNLAKNPKYAKVLAEYRLKLLNHLKETKDPILAAYHEHLKATSR